MTIMKKILTYFLGAEFMELRWWQKAIGVYWVISLALACCFASGPLSALLIIALNFCVSSALLKYIPQ